MNTQLAADKMLETGKFYTPLELGNLENQHKEQAAGLIILSKTLDIKQSKQRNQT